MSTTISQYLNPRKPVGQLFYKLRTWQKMHRFPNKIKGWSQIVSLNEIEPLERRRLNNNESSTFIRIFDNMQTS